MHAQCTAFVSTGCPLSAKMVMLLQNGYEGQHRQGSDTASCTPRYSTQPIFPTRTLQCLPDSQGMCYCESLCLCLCLSLPPFFFLSLSICSSAEEQGFFFGGVSFTKSICSLIFHEHITTLSCLSEAFDGASALSVPSYSPKLLL